MGYIEQELYRCREWIESALKVYDTHDFEDIKEGVLNGRYHLWHGEDACIITEFIEYPKYRVLNVFLGGGDLKKLMIMRKSVEKFGKETGCKKLVASGRKGWLKVFKNSKDTKKVHGYMYAKELV
tara:strand:+ start:1146 stop:1520 length:375 start_codon:yes stop_codon:yes gene_type:complete